MACKTVARGTLEGGGPFSRHRMSVSAPGYRNVEIAFEQLAKMEKWGEPLWTCSALPQALSHAA